MKNSIKLLFARYLIIILILSSIGCAHNTYKYTIPTAGALDVASTQYAFNKGYVEGNPIFKNSSMTELATYKVIGISIGVLLCKWLHKKGYHKTAKFIEIYAVGLWTGASVWNFTRK